MAVIAIINRKGGVGKSTIATHVAAWLAHRGLPVMLGDVDRQQSSRLWLNLRPEQLPPIQGWTVDERNFARPPAGVKHVVLDTPGGFEGLALMKVAQYADAILIPAGTSLFDRRSAEGSLQELRGYPRIVSGKCQLACVGVRIDGRTRNAALLQAWAEEHGLAYLGSIKAAQAYSRCLENGMSMFDVPAAKAAPYLTEWEALTAWLSGVLEAREEVPAKPAHANEPDPRIRPVIRDGILPEHLRR